MIADLEERVKKLTRMTQEPLERGSYHRAFTVQLPNTSKTEKGKRVVTKGKKYVKGFVSDIRIGRHDPIFLETWHEVVRNTEIVPKASEQTRRRRSYD